MNISSSLTSTFFYIFLLLSTQLLSCPLFADSDVKEIKAKPLHIAYLSPKESEFWQSVNDFLNDVAKDLDIKLTTIRFDARNPFNSLHAMKDLLASHAKPDYLLYHYQYQSGAKILQLANQANIKVFIFNTDIPEEERHIVGYPRKKNAHWIGHMFPDDEFAGYQLLDAMVQIKQGNEEKSKNIDIIGLGNWTKSTAIILRKRGLMRRLKEDPNLTLSRLIQVNDSHEEIEKKTEILSNAYRKTSIFWAGSDFIALGMSPVVERLKLKTGNNILIGGIDWTKEAIQSVHDGKLTLSLGGHFMEAGWALILINDYHYGIDFSAEMGETIKNEMQVITQENVSPYLKLFGNERWKGIDFKKFSKYYTPKLTRYDFSLDALLKAQGN